MGGNLDSMRAALLMGLGGTIWSEVGLGVIDEVG